MVEQLSENWRKFNGGENLLALVLEGRSPDEIGARPGPGDGNGIALISYGLGKEFPQDLTRAQTRNILTCVHLYIDIFTFNLKSVYWIRD